MIDKFKASAMHLLISLILISFIIGVIIYFWFPHSFVSISNFKEITLLIISIDLVLGPILTFVVFKPKKKGLKLDLSVIAACQMSALLYGVFTLYQSHPVFITFNVDRFTLVMAADVEIDEATLKEFKISKFSFPKLAVAKIPSDKEAKSELLMEVLEGKPDIAYRPSLYQPYEDNISDILEKSLDPDVIFGSDESKLKLDKFIEKYGSSVADYAYLPLEGPFKDVIWALDKKSANPVGMISVNPWTVNFASKSANSKSTTK